MSFRSDLKLESRIFNRAELTRAISNAVVITAKEFKQSTGDKMENSPHTGEVVTKARGGNFRVRHQQSRRGQRPAPFSRNLLNALTSRKTGDTSAVVEIDDGRAPYAEILQRDLGRIIMSKEDAAEAERQLQRGGNEAIKNLL